MSLSQTKSAYLFHSSTRNSRMCCTLREPMAKRIFDHLPLYLYIYMIEIFKILFLSWSPSQSHPTNPAPIMRNLFLTLFWISHAMAAFSKLPRSPAQEGAVALPTTLLPTDASKIYGSPLEPSPWTTAGSSNNEPRCQ